MEKPEIDQMLTINLATYDTQNFNNDLVLAKMTLG